MLQHERPRILKPITGHTDTFRELVDLWAEEGFCEVIPCEGQYVWLGEVGDVLLFDWDRFDHLPASWNVGLFGNPIPKFPRSFCWTYFPRRPRLLRAFTGRDRLQYEERPVSSIFLGRIENPQQGQARVSAGSDWPQYIEKFSCPVVIGAELKYPFTQQEYLEELSRARFGLCLPGYGPKCNREIELLALGTVPIVTPGVDTEHYFEPMKEGVHYLRVQEAREIPALIEGISASQWQFLSSNGVSWYERNCSIEGSWRLTVDLVNATSRGMH